MIYSIVSFQNQVFSDISKPKPKLWSKPKPKPKLNQNLTKTDTTKTKTMSKPKPQNQNYTKTKSFGPKLQNRFWFWCMPNHGDNGSINEKCPGKKKISLHRVFAVMIFVMSSSQYFLKNSSAGPMQYLI